MSVRGRRPGVASSSASRPWRTGEARPSTRLRALLALVSGDLALNLERRQTASERASKAHASSTFASGKTTRPCLSGATSDPFQPLYSLLWALQAVLGLLAYIAWWRAATRIATEEIDPSLFGCSEYVGCLSYSFYPFNMVYVSSRLSIFYLYL